MWYKLQQQKTAYFKPLKINNDKIIMPNPKTFKNGLKIALEKKRLLFRF